MEAGSDHDDSGVGCECRFCRGGFWFVPRRFFDWLDPLGVRHLDAWERWGEEEEEEAQSGC